MALVVMVSVLVHAAGLGVHGLLLKVAVEPVVGTPESVQGNCLRRPRNECPRDREGRRAACVTVMFPLFESV